MRHLFLTVHECAFGEVLLARRIAEELALGGDEVWYLAPRALAPALRGAAVRFGTIDHARGLTDRVLSAIVADSGADSVFLVDAMSTFSALASMGQDCGRLVALPAPVLALDVWDLATSGLVIDFTDGWFELDARVLGVPRLVPVPFARPTAAGAYRSLRAPTVDPAARARGRARLGLAAGDAMVLFPTATWQHVEAVKPQTQPSARAVPALLAAYVKAAGARLVHVGPWRLPGIEVLGDAYHHLPQLPPAEFADLMAAADLLLSLNASATSIGGALAARVPVLLLHHESPPARVGAPSLAPFRAWPYGLSRLLAGVLANNPFAGVVASAELLDEPAVLGALESLLRDPRAIAEARQRTDGYLAEVATLPSGRERYLEALRTARP